MTLEERLEEIKAILIGLVQRQQVREWYSTRDVAKLLDKAELTVADWCRRGRIQATKKRSGRGAHASWAISHEEVLRVQREGLLPVTRRHDGTE
jgi:transposase